CGLAVLAAHRRGHWRPPRARHARQLRRARARAARPGPRRRCATHRIRRRGRSGAMKAFAALYRALDRSTSLNDKRAAIVAYLENAPPHDAAWALAILSGGKLARIANTTELRRWIAEESGCPDWLVDECHAHVGDLAETLTLLLDDPPAGNGTRAAGR